MSGIITSVLSSERDSDEDSMSTNPGAVERFSVIISISPPALLSEQW
jgi:hypothetical protein